MVIAESREQTETDTLARVSRDGYAVIQEVLSADHVESLRRALSRLGASADADGNRGIYAARGLMQRLPEVADLAISLAAERLVQPVLGAGWRPVKATHFDKTPNANWKVPWHQDLTIAVRDKGEVTGFGPWTIKSGIPHTQAPSEVLERMVAVRFALDDNEMENGPLKVLPGTHLQGRLTPQEISILRRARPEASCFTRAGGAVIMRPLLLHSSSAMRSGTRRRVVHIEYAGCDLPGGLEWYT